MPVCGSCATENPDIARFCLACGTPLARACPSCNTENPGVAQFCMACGTPLAGAPAPAAPTPPAAAAPAPAASPAEERRPITAVFVDMVGSTSRAENLDPEDVLALLEPYYTRLRHVLEQHGGIVEKFIGDAVVALFGAPIAHGDDPERAVRAGLGILNAIAALNEEDASRQLEVRVGVTTGEAIVALDARVDEGRGMAWGDVLNTAARLQSAAPVNGMLVDERTYRACTSSIVFAEAEPVTAKGKTEPVRVWQATGVRHVERDATPQSRLVGRQTELKTLVTLWQGVVADTRPAFAVVVAEPGLGKTRLVAEAAAQADNADVHWGGCLAYGDGITYWPVIQIVKEAAGILATDDLAIISTKLDRLIDGLPIQDVDQLRTIASALSNLLGAPTTPRGTYVTTEISQSELHWGIRRVFELLASQRPLVLVLEDVHWAEPTLVELIVSLLSTNAPILVLATARPELGDAHPQLLVSMANRTVIALDALSEHESEELVSDLVESLVERGLDRSVVTRMLAHAHGNPLFLEETVQMLLDAETLDPAEIEALPTPESLQSLVAARLDGLPASERHLAQHASVAGVTFWSGAAARLDDRSEPPDDLLGSLARRTIVHEHDASAVAGEREWEFKHMVIRDVAYGRLPKGRRVGLHVRFADWITELPDHGEEFVEILAFHLEQSCLLSREVGRTDIPPPVKRAVDALARAAEKAEHREGLDEADRFYARALQLVPEEDGERRSELSLRRARVHVGLGELRRARDELETIAHDLNRFGRDDLRCDALIAIGNIAGRQGRSAEAADLLRAAEELSERVGVSELRIRAAYEAAWWHAYFGGETDAAVAKLERTLELADTERDLALRIGGHLRLGMLLVNVARLEEAETVLARCAELAGERGSVREAARVTHQLGLIKLYRGEVDAAQELLLQADEWLNRTSDGNFLIQNLRVLGKHALAANRLEDAEAYLVRAQPLAQEYGGYFAIEIARLLVETLLRQGRLADARAVAAEALSDVASEDAAALGASKLMEGTLACTVGDGEPGRAAFQAAIDTFAGTGFKLDLGEAHLDYGIALVSLGDDEGAARQLGLAAEIFTEVGALGPLREAALHQAVLVERAGTSITTT